MSGLPARRGGRECPKAGRDGDCHQLHFDCSAHNRRGGPCGAQPLTGTDPPYCYRHVGRSLDVVRAETLARRKAEHAFRAAQRAAERYGFDGDLDVLAELLKLADECLRWKQVCAALVEQVEEVRYRTGSGEWIRGEIQLYTSALERAAKILTDLAKLNIEERRLARDQRQAGDLVQVIDGALTALGHDPEAQAIAAAVEEQLTLLDARYRQAAR